MNEYHIMVILRYWYVMSGMNERYVVVILRYWYVMFLLSYVTLGHGVLRCSIPCHNVMLCHDVTLYGFRLFYVALRHVFSRYVTLNHVMLLRGLA